MSFQVPKGNGGQIKSLQPANNTRTKIPIPLPRCSHHALIGPVPQAILQAAQRNDEPFYTVADTDYTLAYSGLKRGGLIVVGLPIPRGISATTQRLRTAADDYWTLFRERRQIRALYMGLLASPPCSRSLPAAG